MWGRPPSAVHVERSSTKRERMYDLIIIGGGPAGSAAAITAAREGASVLLLERGRYPRHKVCGEFVSAESLGLLSSLLAGSLESRSLLQHARRTSQGRLFIDGSVLAVAIDPPAASIARFDLDTALWQAATRDGVDTRQQEMVKSIDGSGPFAVATSSGVWEARSVINASGRWSNLSTKNGADGTGEKWIGLKAHFLEAKPAPSVDLYFFEGGYCGVQPVNLRDETHSDERLSVCTMVRADVAGSLAEVFRCHPELSQRSQAWQPLSEPVATSPLIFRTPEPVSNGVLVAGDAAGFVDPFVGDGISLALRSGSLAAESLQPFLLGKTTRAEATEQYREAYQEHLAPVFRTSAKIRRLFALPQLFRAGLLGLFGNAPRLTRYLVRKTR